LEVTICDLQNQTVTSDDQLNQKFIALDRKYDRQFHIVFEAIQQLLEEDKKLKRKMGYVKAPEATSSKKNEEICSQ
jgi:hypothetical protein